jgi:hypothetical protein
VHNVDSFALGAGKDALLPGGRARFEPEGPDGVTLTDVIGTAISGWI